MPRQVSNFFNLLLIFFVLFDGQVFAQGQTDSKVPILAPRELVVLKPAIDGIWGTWIAAVIHRGAKPEEMSFFVNLPREAVDFQPGEGLEPKDLKLEQDGIVIRKVFAPGVNVISLIFAARATYGEAALTFVSKRDLPEMTVMTPRGLLTVEGDGLAPQGEDQQEGQRYTVFGLSKPLVAGQEFKMRIAGVPEGRGRLWILGGIAAALLVLTSVWLVLRTKPKMVADQPEGAFT